MPNRAWALGQQSPLSIDYAYPNRHGHPKNIHYTVITVYY